MTITNPIFQREDLAQFFGSNPRLMRAFEDQSAAVEEATNSLAATIAMKDATVIVLSANGDFTNERVLEVSDDIDVEVTATTVKLTVKKVARTEDFGVTFVPPAQVLLFLPPDGTLVSAESPALLENKTFRAPFLAAIPNHVDDAAAAAGGVGITQVYRNGSVLMVRVT